MEYATLIFCDIVGFSRNDDDSQAQLIRGLNAEVTHQLFDRISGLERSVIFLPTGDGLAIVLKEQAGLTGAARKAEVFGLIERLMRFAVGKKPEDRKGYLRIGIHGGGVSQIRDINGNVNVCGRAINDCQRIMNAARENQVLVSSEAYRTLAGDGRISYSGPPFDDTRPAQFSPPFTFIAKHGLNLEVRIMFREGEQGWERAPPLPRGLIVGKTPRTEFLVRQLRELLGHSKQRVNIYEQSAFSTLGVCSKRTLWGNTPPDYLDLILEQKELLAQLVKEERTTTKLILRPIRNYDAQWMIARCDALLKWLNKFKDYPNVDFVVVDDYEVPNRFIVEDHFCLEGYKMHDTSGFELSFVRTEAHEINEAVESFNRIFTRRYQGKAQVIRYFESLRKDFDPADSIEKDDLPDNE